MWLSRAIMEDQLVLWAAEIESESRYCPLGVPIAPGGIVAISKSGKAMEYANYARALFADGRSD